jgi:hypothetical protein
MAKATATATEMGGGRADQMARELGVEWEDRRSGLIGSLGRKECRGDSTAMGPGPAGGWVGALHVT